MSLQEELVAMASRVGVLEARLAGNQVPAGMVAGSYVDAQNKKLQDLIDAAEPLIKFYPPDASPLLLSMIRALTRAIAAARLK